MTHRAIVAYQSTNQATVIDLVNPNSALHCTTPPCVVQQIGGGGTSYSTGVSPSVAIDPSINWAVITPGGAGSIPYVS